MKSFSDLMSRARVVLRSLRHRSVALWRRYRQMPLWQQIVIAIALVALVITLIIVLTPHASDENGSAARTVTVAPIAELSGSGGSVNVIGNVRSVTEAALLAQSSGSVTSVNTSLGASVPAGFVIAELDNAPQRAAVLQAEGAYEAAVAARGTQSLPDTNATAEAAYQSAYTTLDTAIRVNADTFFGDPGVYGPRVLIATDDQGTKLSTERAHMTNILNTWQSHLAGASNAAPQTLLDEAQADLQEGVTFFSDLAVAANQRNSSATSAQLSALATGRAAVNGALTSINASRSAYRTGSSSATAGSDATVKQALGALRAAQANLEHTIIRAPIAGQVNFLSIRVGDYATALTHVATVAQNGALEIVTQTSEDDRQNISVGTKVTIDDTYKGVVTAIAPALDPVTKQIEVHIAVSGDTDLVNGQSVRIGFPNLATTKKAETAGPLLLPLTALKLTSTARVVFSVGPDNRLVAHAVTIGDVRGDRIEITTDLPPDLQIVTDARGLSEGQEVKTVLSAAQ